MGRIVELITDVAASANEEGVNLTLPMVDFDRLRDDWGDDEIEDALALAQTAFHHEAVSEAAESLCARVIEVLGTFADEKRFAGASEEGAAVPVETLAHLARSVAYLDEALSLVRDAPAPDLTQFNQLLERLANRGIETEMGPLPALPKDEGEIEH